MKEAIRGFKDEYRFLSNFHPSSVFFEGLTYPTVEHAYVSAKSNSTSFKKEISELPASSAGKAKRMGRKTTIKNDWDNQKLFIMSSLVTTKFTTHEDLRDLLVDTDPAELIEENYWGDTFWGVCDGEGHNNLGKILMRVRNNLTKDKDIWF